MSKELTAQMLRDRLAAVRDFKMVLGTAPLTDEHLEVDLARAMVIIRLSPKKVEAPKNGA